MHPVLAWSILDTRLLPVLACLSVAWLASLFFRHSPLVQLPRLSCLPVPQLVSPVLRRRSTTASALRRGRPSSTIVRSTISALMLMTAECSPIGLCLCLVLNLVPLALSNSLMPVQLSPSLALLLLLPMTTMTITTMRTILGRYLLSPPVAVSAKPLVRLLQSRRLLSRSCPVRVLPWLAPPSLLRMPPSIPRCRPLLLTSLLRLKISRLSHMCLIVGLLRSRLDMLPCPRF